MNSHPPPANLVVLSINHSRGESYSIRNRTGPRTGSDRTGPDWGSSVRPSVQTIFIFGLRSDPGLDRWTKYEKACIFFVLQLVARSCLVARADCAKVLPPFGIN